MASSYPHSPAKPFSNQVLERGFKLIGNMQRNVDTRKPLIKKGAKMRKTGPKREGRSNPVQPVSTIIQSLANISNITVEDIVKQLTKERAMALTNGKPPVRVAQKKKPVNKNHSAKKPAVKKAAPARTAAPGEGNKSTPSSAVQIASNVKPAAPAQTIADKWKAKTDPQSKGAVVLSRIKEDDTEANSVPAKPDSQQRMEEKKNKILENNWWGKVVAKETQLKPPTLPVNASLQKKPNADVVIKSDVIAKIEPNIVNQAAVCPAVSNQQTNSSTSSSASVVAATAPMPASNISNNTIVTGKGPESASPKTMYELKMQLIDRFNKKRMEEKAKAQLNQERLSVVTQVEVPPIKVTQGQTGELMNLGIGLKRSEMLEKEYLTVANFVPKKRYLQLKLKAEEALRKEMTYAICGRSNGWPTVRRYFMARNWVERFAADCEDKRLALPSLQQAPDNDSLVLSRLTSRMPTKFVWTEINLNWTLIPASTIVNKFPASIRPVSTKVGLLLHLNNQVWTYNPNYSYVKHPRSLSLYDEEDMRQFAAQFRMNACVCLLKHLVECFEQDREIVAANGTVPLESVDFAIQRVCEQVTYMESADLDLWHNSVISDDEWTLFLLRFHDIAHFGAKFRHSSDYNVPKMVACAKLCLRHVKDFWPDIDVEGVRNLWIIKPSASSCGKGIRIFKTLVDVQTHCKPGFSFLAQKYIERPMFIYKTKFDIRQWFVISSLSPLVIYLYDICYLRFCSREFSLLNLHESIHLSNNSVQCRYSNMTTRSSELPSDNMWDSDTFVNYLRARKEDDKWYAITLPGIRKAITGAFLAGQDMMTHRTNSFNLYGADFMLTEDFVPWLIEINNGPCLRPTTSVTSRLCPMVIEDTVNLILKTKHGGTQANQPTHPGGHVTEVGRFKLIYAQKLHPPPASRSNLPDLTINAKKARIHNEKYYQERKRQPTGVPMFKDTIDDSPLGSYEHRSLKYEKIAFYKVHPVSIVKTTTLDDTKRPPIPPGGVLSQGMTEYRTSFVANAFTLPSSPPASGASMPAVSRTSDSSNIRVTKKEEEVKHRRAQSQVSLPSNSSAHHKVTKVFPSDRRGGITGKRTASKLRRRGE